MVEMLLEAVIEVLKGDLVPFLATCGWSGNVCTVCQMAFISVSSTLICFHKHLFVLTTRDSTTYSHLVVHPRRRFCR